MYIRKIQALHIVILKEVKNKKLTELYMVVLLLMATTFIKNKWLYQIEILIAVTLIERFLPYISTNS